MPEAKEKCGVFGVANVGPEAARLAHTALWALQHRGQEASGIASSDGWVLRVHKDGGLVAHVYADEDLDALPGDFAIGHNRYGTSGTKGATHIQPVYRGDNGVALAHNGNLPTVGAVYEFVKDGGLPVDHNNDTELMTDALRIRLKQGATLEEAVRDCYPLFTGAFSLVILGKEKLVAVRDPRGIRPLSIGQINGGYVFASETCALDTIRASYVRDVLPGEMVVADARGLTSHQITEGMQKLDIFEFVYFARPDSMLMGRRVNEVRLEFGRELGRHYPIAADVVVPVPDSAIPAAEGYAEATGIPYRNGFVKNRYIHRTFIRPDQRLRDYDVALKLNPLPEVLTGKDVVVIDDSVVRGTTSRTLVGMVRRAGARRVHLLISSPPVMYPDFYGIDTPDQSKLIASRMSVEDIRQFIGADSLFYLPYDAMIRATGLPEDIFSTSCFTGIYPIDIGDRATEIANVGALHHAL